MVNDLENMFTYHPPKGDQAKRYVSLRETMLFAARKIAQLTPQSAEQTLAIRALHLASMHANSAIAMNE